MGMQELVRRILEEVKKSNLQLRATHPGKSASTTARANGDDARKRTRNIPTKSAHNHSTLLTPPRSKSTPPSATPPVGPLPTAGAAVRPRRRERASRTGPAAAPPPR